MGYSAKIKIDHARPKQDGTAAIFLQVIIDRKKTRIDLDISWPPSKFNLKDLTCKPRQRADEDVEEYNVIIENARSKANSIHKEYLIKGIHLNLESFQKEYRSNLNKNDFILYFGQKSYERWNKSKINDDTYEKEKGTLNRLQSFASVIPFHEFNHEWAFDFDKHLKKQFKNEHNTRWARHKHITTYLNIARDIDKIQFSDPYARFKNKLVESSWGPLTLEQMKLMVEWYLKWKANPLPYLKRKNGIKQVDTREGLTFSEVGIVRKFLFACNTSLRISDMNNQDESLFTNGNMSITPHKTERYGTKIKDVPLNDIARMLLEDEIVEVRQARTKGNKETLRIFERYSDQYCNRMLKRVATKLKLTVNLHMHVARYTFGSLMDQAGANHTAMMKYMGLKKRDTLEKYVKTNSGIISEGVSKMNTLINDVESPANTLAKT
jgi:integrase/recombinase XerD